MTQPNDLLPADLLPEGLEDRLPAEAVPYLNESRYCPSNKFHAFVERRFGELEGGTKVQRMRDWIETHFTYVSGSSDAETGALDSVNATQQKSTAISEAYEKGEVVDVAKVMLARQEAGIAFEATLQVRNKLLSAYQDIMRMGV